MCVTVDGVSISDSIFNCLQIVSTHKYEYYPLAISTFYSWLLHILVFSVYCSIHYPFPGIGS
jgi:hypothetical protein